MSSVPDLEIVHFWPRRQELVVKKGKERLVWVRKSHVCLNPPGQGGVSLCQRYTDRLCPDPEHTTCPECIVIWTSRMARAIWG